MNERQFGILNMDAVALAAEIADRRVSSLDAVNTYILHINKIDPALNCMTENRFAAARREAQEADARLSRGEGGGRLSGVPVTVKEAFDIAGMKTTGGLPSRQDMVSSQDSEVVLRLKKAGAVFLGKTNTPVLCFCQETDNKLYGRTNNPWDVTKTAGGSSGGEGALIAAGGAAVGIGSDIGGSIRFPSHFNGVVGFRSGQGQVSHAGTFPEIEIPLQERMMGIGAIAKSVRDARLINEIIAVSPPPPRTLNNFSVTMPIDNLYYPVDNAVYNCLTDIKKYLTLQMEVTDAPPPYYTDAARLWQLIMSIGIDDAAAMFFDGKPVRLYQEYLREVLFKSSELHRYFTWAIIGAKMFAPAPEKIAEIEKTIVAGEQTVSHYLDNRLLILPVYHTAALKHGQVIREIFSVRRTFLRYMPFVAYSNTWGLPALTVPVAEDKTGMPAGIQIISRNGNEEAIFKLGELLEKHFRGYRRAPVT
ncbi:MAG TPA: amidase [Syntrophomonadaceae bacterium]|nr:amidase [Syntrophomonadaceae bacterium]HPR92855.1 amidase [Syntrophomonadaceae bacterium]